VGREKASIWGQSKQPNVSLYGGGLGGDGGGEHKIVEKLKLLKVVPYGRGVRERSVRRAYDSRVKGFAYYLTKGKYKLD